MFFPAYQLGSFETEQEALQFVEMTTEDLNHSVAGFAVSGDVIQKSAAKMITGDGTVIFEYDTEGRVNVWFCDDYWECPELDDAEELIESVEGGIPAEKWAIFQSSDNKILSVNIHR